MGVAPALFFFLSVGAVTLFAFIAVASWAESRRREREAYYKNETLKKIAESQGAAAVLDLLREEQAQSEARRREGLKLGGLVNIAVGVGLFLFLGGLIHNERVYLVGVIPLLIGVALLGYVLFMQPRR